MTILKQIAVRSVLNISLTVLLTSCSCKELSPENYSNQSIKTTNLNDLTEEQLDNEESDFVNYDSGLRCEILHQGPSNSKLPTQGQLITAHYSCWYNQAGKQGDLLHTSHAEGIPIQFKIGLGEVILAWDEALVNMRIGDKCRLYIPAELAYGSIGNIHLIAGDTDLICDIEIIEIN